MRPLLPPPPTATDRKAGQGCPGQRASELCVQAAGPHGLLGDSSTGSFRRAEGPRHSGWETKPREAQGTERCQGHSPLSPVLLQPRHWPFIYIYIFLTSLLEYNCFTMMCWFLPYNQVNQLYVYTYPHISSLLRLPPSHPPYPTPLCGHKAPS